MDYRAKGSDKGIFKLIWSWLSGKVCQGFERLTVREKRYYLAEVIKILGISRNGFYNWERAGKVPKPKRDPMSDYRYWTEEDLKRLKKITGRG